jgi:hypothetical protein
MIIFLKILLAHFLGDFIFQTRKMVQQKEKLKEKSILLYFHAFLHGALALLLLWDVTLWPYILIIIVTHFIIDLIKIYYQNQQWRREAFFIDQFLHILVLIILSFIISKENINFEWVFSTKNLILFTAVVFLTTPSSIFIKIFISKWTPQKMDRNAQIESLESAGNWIGILERLLILVFILVNRWEAVGFLLAAKSIFRFGDLKEGDDRKLTEYILIGTLASFGLAILTAMLSAYLLNNFESLF